MTTNNIINDKRGRLSYQLNRLNFAVIARSKATKQSHLFLFIIFLILSFPLSAASNSLTKQLANIDYQLLNEIQSNNEHVVLDYAFESISLGSPILEGGYALTNMIDSANDSKKARNEALIDTSILIGSQVVNLSLKYIIKRQRPKLGEAAYKPRIFSSRITPSFPSGHAASSFALAAIIWDEHPRYRIPTLTYALISGYSQVYVGNHYPSDVIAAAILGFGLEMLANKFR